mgnify:CR=1 FL=1
MLATQLHVNAQPAVCVCADGCATWRLGHHALNNGTLLVDVLALLHVLCYIAPTFTAGESCGSSTRTARACDAAAAY